MTRDALLADLSACASDIEAALEMRLSARAAPERLVAAMRHGALEGGKRLRPYLVRASAQLFDVPPHRSTTAGMAIECVHCYSLIHDDLPEMDNDRLRRGKPTVWAAFDPALAILAGDALLTEAFAILSDPECHHDPQVRADLVATLARAAGAAGMVGGQVRDIEGETTPLDEAGILEMEAQKTGALLEAAASMGALLGAANGDDRAALARYGAAAGRAFQLADDILDVTASSQALGKTAGKDVDQNKSTIVARRGVAGARALLADAVAEGEAALEPFGERAQTLRALLAFIAERES